MSNCLDKFALDCIIFITLIEVGNLSQRWQECFKGWALDSVGVEKMRWGQGWTHLSLLCFWQWMQWDQLFQVFASLNPWNDALWPGIVGQVALSPFYFALDRVFITATENNTKSCSYTTEFLSCSIKKFKDATGLSSEFYSTNPHEFSLKTWAVYYKEPHTLSSVYCCQVKTSEYLIRLWVDGSHASWISTQNALGWESMFGHGASSPQTWKFLAVFLS